VTDVPDFRPKQYKELCPKADEETISLLSQMLVIDPKDRVSVEKALDHPYLSTYHDAKDEPRNNKVFDFSFEAEIAKLKTDDEKRNRLKILLGKEVESYQKPALVDFGSLFATKPLISSPGGKDDPYANLNDFFAQLAHPAGKAASSTATRNALLDANSGNPLLSQPSEPSEPTNSLLNQQKPVNPLLAGASNPLLPQVSIASDNNQLLSEAKVTNTHPTQSTNPLLPANSEPGNTLLAAQETTNPLLAYNKPKEKEKGSLEVNTVTKPHGDDIEMLSAKLTEQAVISEQPTEIEDSTPLDTKSLIRQRIMQSQLHKKSGW